MRDYTVKLSYSGGIMANRDTSRASGNTRRGILYISRRKHFENYILFQHAHRICMTIVFILSISAILNSQNWSVVCIVSSHTVPNFWPWDRDVPTCPPPKFLRSGRNLFVIQAKHKNFGKILICPEKFLYVCENYGIGKIL